LTKYSNEIAGHRDETRQTMTDAIDTSANTPTERIDTRDAARSAVARVIEQSRHNLLVFAPVLDAHLFNSAEAGAALAAFVARHHDNRARFVVGDGGQALRDNPRLVALARRFPDAVSLRQTGEDHRNLRELMVIADHRGYFHLENVERLDGLLAIEAPQAAVTLMKRFHEIWDRSEPLTGLHTLGL
jgi:hypothetical protein